MPTYQPATIDTFIYSYAATTNYSTDVGLYVGEVSGVTGAIGRSLIKWNQLSDGTIPSNAVITSCVLSIAPYDDRSASATTLRVFRTKRAWVDNQATWNIYSTGNNWQTAGGFGADDCEQTDIGNIAVSATETLLAFKDITLTTSAIQEIVSGTWTNNGFLIKTDLELDDCYFYASSDYTVDTSLRLKLTVTWTVPTVVKILRTRRGINLLGRQGRRLVF